MSGKNKKKNINDSSPMSLLKSNKSSSNKNTALIPKTKKNEKKILRLSSSSDSSESSLPPSLNSSSLSTPSGLRENQRYLTNHTPSKSSNVPLQVQSSIKISKKNEDSSHALVFWTEEQIFSVVSTYAIHSKPGEKITESSEYNISFGNKIYVGEIRFLGPQKKCCEILKTISGKDEKDINEQKAQPFKSRKETDSNDELKRKIKLFEQETIRLKAKIVELGEALETETDLKNKIKEENKDLQEKIYQHEQTFNKEEIKRLLSMCQIFENLYSPKFDQNVEVLVPLSDKYPEIMINRITRQSIHDNLQKCSEKNGGLYFRKIMLLLIPDSSAWTSRTAAQIKTDFPNFVNPVFDLVKGHDPIFTVSQMNQKLNSIIQDLRKNDDNLQKKQREPTLPSVQQKSFTKSKPKTTKSNVLDQSENSENLIIDQSFD